MTTVRSRGDTLLLPDLHLHWLKGQCLQESQLGGAEGGRWKVPLLCTSLPDNYSSTAGLDVVWESPSLEDSSCHQPAAFSQSLGPTVRLCCLTRSPPRTPGAPAAAPSPTLPTHLNARVNSKVIINLATYKLKLNEKMTAERAFSFRETVELTLRSGGAVLIQHPLLHLFLQVLLVDGGRVESVTHKLRHSRTC